ETAGGAQFAESQLDSSDNMTDTLAALRGLVWSGAEAAAPALKAFEQCWKADALVMDKWFTIQAMKPGPDTVVTVRRLLDHEAFSIGNPNKVRSLIGAFAMANPTAFHAADGSGYRLHSGQILALDALNPQVAARMASAFNSWHRQEAVRRALMKSELEKIASADRLSPDVSEIVNSSLEMEPAE
ncbi:MAG: aminopeptidase N, partial [Gammaproteobacteria bacterium]|nr:aminopeptidase N [Gammaproteobacteria bacterium]